MHESFTNTAFSLSEHNYVNTCKPVRKRKYECIQLQEHAYHITAQKSNDTNHSDGSSHVLKNQCMYKVKRKSNTQNQDHAYHIPVQGKKDTNKILKQKSTPLYDLNKSTEDLTLIEKIHGTFYANIPVPGDGNCFFHCLSMSFYGNFEHSDYYRHLICKHIIKKWSFYEDFATLTHDLTGNKVELYKTQMLHKQGWATNCEISAACELLNVNIHVWLKGMKFDKHLKRVASFHLSKYFAKLNTISTIELLLFNNHFSILYHKVKHISHQSKQKSSMQTVKSEKKKTIQNRGEQNKLPTMINEKLSQKVEVKEKARHINSLHSLKLSKTKTKQKVKINRTLKPVEQIDQSLLNSISTQNMFHSNKIIDRLYEKCRKLGLIFNKQAYSVSTSVIERAVKKAQSKFGVDVKDLPSPPPLKNNDQYNIAMDSIRAFELEQMSYEFQECIHCHEYRLEMKMKSHNVCYKCHSDKNDIKMYSAANKMDPGLIPKELQNLSLVEQQLISRLAPVMHIHMLKHGGVSAKGHCVTFPQDVNEPARILPKLAKDITILRVRKPGAKNLSKEFNVRRFKVQQALTWLKIHNEAYSDIEISEERLNLLPEDGEIFIDTIHSDTLSCQNDLGPAPEQVSTDDVSGETSSTVTLPEQSFDLKEGVQNIIKNMVSEIKKPNKVVIPWPSQNNVPMSEFTAQFFFTLSFPCLFPYALGDFHINRLRTCTSMSEWAEHLMWYKDGRFARHKYFKFIVHNIIMRKRTLEQSSYIMKQQIGEEHMSLEDLKQKLQKGDNTIAPKILYFGACLRGTSQYWSQRNREVKSLIKYQVNEGKGLPGIFTTGSCAEFHFKPLKRLLALYIKNTKNTNLDLNNRNTLFSVLQEHSHIVSHYFDLRTKSYFNTVMKNAFNVDTYWYRYEFAKSRGMIHWHGLCWRSDREPHLLLHEALQKGLDGSESAEELSTWAKTHFCMTGSHPAGKDELGNPKKELWAPPEGTAPPPSDENNPLIKLLLDVSESQDTLLQDHILLTNRINLHRCSDYCLQQKHGQKIRSCRMEFGSESKPGKEIKSCPALVKDKNGCLRLEMERDHPMMVQHSQIHTQGWRANGDMSIILSDSGPDNPSVSDIIATEKYVTGYACKGNQSTGELVDLFNVMANSSDDSKGSNGKTICTKFLMNTVKRDISNTESSFELLGLPLFHCSHQFLSVSFTGSRILEKTGKTLTKSTPLDRYLSRPNEDRTSWYQHICNQGRVPVVSGGSTHATCPLTEDYARSMMLLHFPNWRHISDIKHDKTSWVENFTTFLETTVCPNFVKADVERAQAKEPEKKSSDTESESEDQEGEQPEWVQLMRPNLEVSPNENDFEFDDGGLNYDWGETSINYPTGYGLKFVEKINDHDENVHTDTTDTIDMSTLNIDQKFAFNMVLQTLIKYKRKEPFKPLRMIVSGTAGSGKSYLIKSLVYAITRLFSTGDAVQVLCPTGNSANLISGTTIHSFLKIPTSYKVTKDMKAPDGLIGQQLQNNCNGMVALFVDERSLVGCTTLGWMEFHCRYGMKNESSDWGGLPVVVFLGDDVQLPPVCDSPVYHCKSKFPAAMHGAFIWKSFNTAVHLQTIVRQNADQHFFKNVLMSLRTYSLSTEQAKWLQSFQWNDMKKKYGSNEMNDVNDNGLFVFPTHAAEWQHNNLQLQKANENFPVAKLSSVNEGTHAKSASSDKASGLINTLYICKNAKVMLTCNLNVDYGLFNGSTGIVQDIIYLDGRSPKESLPDVVMVLFFKYSGPPLC